MATPALKDYFEALCCPTCQGQLVLTQERIVFCQNCLAGYRVVGTIPDLRPEHAISFRREANNPGLNAVLTVVMGESLSRTITVARDHCVVLGRVSPTDDEATVAGRAPTTTALDGQTQKLIEKFLTRKSRKVLPIDLPLRSKAQLGDFQRDGDFLFLDASVSRLHAVLYQDAEGLWVLDLVSRNGTFVNGREVETARLKNNDVLSLGNVSMGVRLL